MIITVIKMNRKFFLAVLVAILLGSILGHTLFQKYQQEESQVFQEKGTYFFIEGAYDNQERAENATNHLAAKLIVKEDNHYVVYVGITNTKDNVEKLKKFFQESDIQTTIKQMTITDESFLTNLDQMDGLLKQIKTKSELWPINKVILATYEELINKQT